MAASTRAVVVGGAGFIGSSVVERLASGGAEVLVVDDLSRGRLENLKGPGAAAELAEIDIRDADALHRAVTAFRPEVVFHLAAQIDVRASMADPGEDAWRNVVGSVNVFSAAHAAGARRVVNTSTGGAIYGPDAPVPTPETAPTEPLSAYGLSKRTVETYADWFRRAKGLDVVTLRYGNVYGERQDPKGDAGVIAIFCDAVLEGRRPTVFGDGSQTRDFVYVGDVAAANLAAAAAEGPLRPVYNVGTGREVSIRELLAAVARAAGADPALAEPVLAPARAGEVPRSCLDVREARRDLGLPEPTPLEEGLRHTLDWMRSL
ncbi:NAD-dependent epimerase/dehydratase family protein [Pseudonocardia lutea]|uniref:NAD-dependent epimerase/dehydratase family protein n=1 Tax=Pseudonocardia lutea TaxID=2172015 RepID=A0ABW1IGD6_9PSEU